VLYKLMKVSIAADIDRYNGVNVSFGRKIDRQRPRVSRPTHNVSQFYIRQEL